MLRKCIGLFTQPAIILLTNYKLTQPITILVLIIPVSKWLRSMQRGGGGRVQLPRRKEGRSLEYRPAL